MVPEGVQRLMRVPSEIRECTVFLYGDQLGERKPFGTAFRVAAEVPGHPEAYVTWLVTAAHVVEEIRDRCDNGTVILRGNTREGSSAFIETLNSEWVIPDGGTDYAFLPLPPPPHSILMGRWHLSERSTATPSEMDRYGIGIGDEVFMVGLFARHVGVSRCEPILRVGNLASMPVDPVQTELGERTAYLIEARSTGGLSGSPVFVHLGYTRDGGDGRLQLTGANPFLLLGLVQAHWDVDGSRVDYTGPMSSPSVNVGIAVVVPISEILRTFDSEIAERVSATATRLSEERGATLDDRRTEGDG